MSRQAELPLYGTFETPAQLAIPIPLDAVGQNRAIPRPSAPAGAKTQPIAGDRMVRSSSSDRLIRSASCESLVSDHNSSRRSLSLSTLDAPKEYNIRTYSLPFHLPTPKRTTTVLLPSLPVAAYSLYTHPTEQTVRCPAAKTALSALLVFLFGGIVFGFFNLIDVLLREGAYAHLCQTGRFACDAQVIQLQFIFTICLSVFSAMTLPTGIFLDKFGAKMTTATGLLFIGTGFMLLALSNTTHQWYMYGFPCMAAGGPALLLSSFSFSRLFSPDKAPVVCTLMNGAFDAGALVFRVGAAGYDMGVAWDTLCFGMFGTSVVSLVLVLWVWPPREEAAGKASISSESGFWTQLFSVEFAMMAMFFAFNISCRSVFTLVTLSEQIFKASSSVEQARFITSVIGYQLPIQAVVNIPIVGYLLFSMGYFAGLLVLCVLGLAFGTLLSLAKFLPVDSLFATFGTFALFRTLLFSLVTAMPLKAFGFVHYGKLIAIINLLSVVFNQGHYTAINLSYTWGDFMPVDASFTALGLVFSLYLVYVLHRYGWKFGLYA